LGLIDRGANDLRTMMKTVESGDRIALDMLYKIEKTEGLAHRTVFLLLGSKDLE